jgi:hypothetical protein
MSDNVINFPQRLSGRKNSKERNDPRDHENRIRARELMRLREIRIALSKKGDQPRFTSPLDRLIAAEALWELKEEHTTRGQMASIKEKFFHIHRYMTKPSPQSNDRVTLAKEHIAKLDPYLKAAQAIAEVAGKNVDDFQLHILRNTGYWQTFGHGRDRNKQTPLNDEAASKVAYLIESMCGRIVRDTNLVTLFACMRRIPGQWDVRLGQFRTSGMACLFRTAYSEGSEHWTEAQPLPSVPLVNLPHAIWTLPVRITRVGLAEADAFGLQNDPVSEDEGVESLAEICLHREIRLAIGPTVNADTIGPLFESRPYFELRILDENGTCVDRGIFDRVHDLALISGGSTNVLLGELWHRVTLLAEIEDEPDINQIVNALGDWPSFWDHTPVGLERNCFEHYYFSWTPIDSAYVAYWLDRTEDFGRQPIDFLPGTPEPRPADETWYPRPHLAHSIEITLSDGRLETAMKSEIDRVKKAFEIHETEWRERMQEQTAKLIAEFNSDLRSPHPTDDESSTS